MLNIWSIYSISLFSEFAFIFSPTKISGGPILLWKDSANSFRRRIIIISTSRSIIEWKAQQWPTIPLKLLPIWHFSLKYFYLLMYLFPLQFSLLIMLCILIFSGAYKPSLLIFPHWCSRCNHSSDAKFQIITIIIHFLKKYIFVLCQPLLGQIVQFKKS